MSINNENTAYRRGVILGLTMAEIMMLVIFLILLAFATILKKEREKSEKMLSLISKNNTSAERVIHVLENQDPDIMEELVRAIEKLPEIMKLIKNDELKNDNTEDAAAVISRGIEKLKFEKVIKSIGESLPIEEKFKQAIEEQKKLESEVANLKGQNKSLIKQIESKGKGVDYPPCWADLNGKPEYIYNTDLTSSGIIIHDNHLPNRVEEQASLPIAQIVYEAPLNASAFLQQTYPLLKWGKEHDCRFFVRVADKTEDNQKELYKKLLEAVEGSFYKNLK